VRAAAVQLNSTDDADRNLESADELVAEAAAQWAELIVLPEKWNLLGPGELLAERAEPLASSAAVDAARGWARAHGAFLLAGSIGERLPEGERIANTSVLIDPDGSILATYRKIHMFDVEVGGVTYRESEHERAGEETVTATLEPASGEPIELGLTICYDLRFPELYRVLALAGARVITIPSAFTAATGEPHWEILLRARAIENQLFVIAANQTGDAPPEYSSWGHSAIVDPWGRLLAACDSEVGVAVADLDAAVLDEVRSKLPSLANRRPSAYRWPDQTRIETHA
jgi:deaminated glutathione amidase